MKISHLIVILVSLYSFQNVGHAEGVIHERSNLDDVNAALKEVEQLWNSQNVQALTTMTAEPFSIITPDGVYRNSYFRRGVHELLSDYFRDDTQHRLNLQLSSFSMLDEDTAYLEVTGELGEKDIVITALVRRFGDNWKAHNIHISDLHAKKSIRDD